MNYSSAGCDVCDKDINFSLISSKLNNYLFSKKFLTLLSLSTCTVDEVINFDWWLTAVIYPQFIYPLSRREVSNIHVLDMADVPPTATITGKFNRIK